MEPTVGVKLPTAGRPRRPASASAGEWASRVESLGYDSIWLGESWGVDALLSLAAAAQQTRNIRLCTAVISVFSRTPATIAMAGATLQQLSAGRAVLGLGASHEGFVESLHDREYDRPVRRVHDTIEIVRSLTGGAEGGRYDGEAYSVGEFPAFDVSVPLYNAALGPANRRATGRVADGWIPYIYPISALAEGFETVATAAREAGRDPETIEVAPQILAVVCDDDERAKALVSGYVARYVGKHANYRNALSHWFPDACESIYAAWHEGGRDEASAAVPDRMLEAVSIWGTPAVARERLRAIADRHVVDCPIVYVPRQAPAAIRDRTIRELRPAEWC